jgi:putative ABC transport system permease protein
MSGNTFSIALKIALRELRGGLMGFRVFLACLILGVGTIAGVGLVTGAARDSIAEQGRSLLAGDVEVRLFQRAATPDERAYFEGAGEVSEVVRLRGMARNPASGERLLAEIKAVDEVYPFYGTLKLSKPGSFETLYGMRDGAWGAAVDPNLAERLQAKVGDVIEIGDARFQIRTLIENEPDRSNEGFLLGPTILTARVSIPDTHLLLPGSLYYTHYKIKLPPTTDLAAWQESLEAAFPEAGWQVRDREGSSPGLRRFVENMGMFLALVGLMALVVGGVGVGNAVGNYLQGKTGVIATLKILGADSKTVFAIYLAQVLMLTFAAIVAGLALGLGAAFASTELVKTVFPVPIAFSFAPLPLVTAALFGLAVALMFSLWPLAKAKNLPPTRLLRAVVSGRPAKPEWKFRLAVFALAAAAMAGAIAASPWKGMAAGFVAGAVAVLLVLRGAGAAVSRLAARLPHNRRPALRLAIANLHRPGAATGAVVVSLGLALTLFVLIGLSGANLSARINEQIPEQAPAFFIIDVQKTQVAAFEAAARAVPGFEELRLVPSLRGRITALKGVPAEQAEVDPGSAWVLRGDRVLTYLADIPKGNSIASGAWWPRDYSGPPLVSFAAEEAAGLGLAVGDTLTVNILGRPVEAKIANLRNLDWGTMDLNFTVVFAPGTLEEAPHTFIASLRVADGAEEAAHRLLTDAFPNITVIRMKEILTSIDRTLVQIRAAVDATGALAIVAGILVLGGALAAGYRFRLYDAVILKMLGAVRADVAKAFLLEFALLGLITGLLALAFGTLAAYLVVAKVMEMEFTLFPGTAAATVLGALAITVVFGLFSTWRALGARPLQVLREL